MEENQAVIYGIKTEDKLHYIGKKTNGVKVDGTINKSDVSYAYNNKKIRGSSYKQALKNYAGKHIYEFDKFHIDRGHIGVLIMPAGKSGHMELGYMIGQGKPCFVYFDKEPERWDVMYQFAKEVCFSMEELQNELKQYLGNPVATPAYGNPATIVGGERNANNPITIIGGEKQE